MLFIIIIIIIFFSKYTFLRIGLGEKKNPSWNCVVKFMILYNLLYIVSATVKYALDLEKNVLYVFILILVIEYCLGFFFNSLNTRHVLIS